MVACLVSWELCCGCVWLVRGCSWRAKCLGLVWRRRRVSWCVGRGRNRSRPGCTRPVFHCGSKPGPHNGASGAGLHPCGRYAAAAPGLFWVARVWESVWAWFGGVDVSLSSVWCGKRKKPDQVRVYVYGIPLWLEAGTTHNGASGAGLLPDSLGDPADFHMAHNFVRLPFPAHQIPDLARSERGLRLAVASS